MINLMPDDAKKQLRAARSNIMLLRYMGVLVLAALFLGLILYGSFFLLTLTKDSAQQLIDVNDTKAEEFSATRTQVESLSTSLAEAKTILDQEISYSNVLVNIAQQMPAGNVIEKMTLNSASFGSQPMTLKVYAKTTGDAVALRDRFQSSPLFSNVNFQSISDTAGGVPGYPVSATMTLTLNRVVAQ